jgi:hypothetical protein
MAAHENILTTIPVKEASNRSFGLVFGIVFTVIAIWPVFGDGDIRLWALVAAGAILCVALLVPDILSGPNRLWTLFGKLLNKVFGGVVMAMIFYIAVTPIAVFLRLSGKKVLDLEFEPEIESYWVERNPSGPAPDTMINQF